MKITKYAIIFSVIFLCMFLPVKIQSDIVQALTLKKVMYNQILDGAVQDAVENLVEKDTEDTLALNREEAVHKFYHSLYSGFGILDSPDKQEELNLYLPLLLVTSEDGFYIYYNQLIEEGGDTRVYQCWSEKYTYSYEDGNCIYRFTLGDKLILLDQESGELLEGNYKDLALLYPDNLILKDRAVFEEVRRRSIIDTITEYMQEYINSHNRIAEHYGIDYAFALPVIENEEWYRTIDDVSFLAIFQGYPYEIANERYNRYEIGAARLRKTQPYYTTIQQGTAYYHKAGCAQVTDRSRPIYTRKECAMQGAFPCLDCNP